MGTNHTATSLSAAQTISCNEVSDRNKYKHAWSSTGFMVNKSTSMSVDISSSILATEILRCIDWLLSGNTDLLKIHA